MEHSIHTFAQKPGLRAQIDQLSVEAWPTFLRHGNVRSWYSLLDVFADYQILFCDSADAVVAVGHTVPITWDGNRSGLPQTIEGIFVRAEEDRQGNRAPTALCALAAMVARRHRGQGLSSRVVQQMKALARGHTCTALVAPVRPTWKSRYPLTPMERFVEWKRSDGSPLDPWIRVHWRLGAQALSIAPNTLTVEGTVSEWETWTEMAFPETGSYVIPGGLQPVQIDVEKDVGRYEDPNYWMKHAVEP